jgi:hypothetical protein
MPRAEARNGQSSFQQQLHDNDDPRPQPQPRRRGRPAEQPDYTELDAYMREQRY